MEIPNHIKRREHTLHTSRPLEMNDAANTMARNFEGVMKLQPGAVTILLTEHPQMRPCKINDEPHCHYTVVVEYDEAQKL